MEVRQQKEDTHARRSHQDKRMVLATVPRWKSGPLPIRGRLLEVQHCAVPAVPSDGLFQGITAGQESLF